MKTVNFKGQARVLVEKVKETSKAVLYKTRPVMGITEEEDKERWEKYKKEQIQNLKEYLKICKKERKKKEIEERIKALQEGWIELMWIPKSIL